MFKALFNIIIDLVATVLQLICWPINAAVESALPDLSGKILEVTNVLSTLFDGLSWGLGLLPSVVVETLLFIVSIEIAKHTIRLSTHTLIRVWTVLQKIKFW